MNPFDPENPIPTKPSQKPSKESPSKDENSTMAPQPPKDMKGPTDIPELQRDSLTDSTNGDDTSTNWTVKPAHQRLLAQQRDRLANLLLGTPRDDLKIRELFDEFIVGHHHQLSWNSLWKMIQGLYQAKIPYTGGIITLGGWKKAAPKSLAETQQITPALHLHLERLEFFGTLNELTAAYYKTQLLAQPIALKKNILSMVEKHRSIFCIDAYLAEFIENIEPEAPTVFEIQATSQGEFKNSCLDLSTALHSPLWQALVFKPKNGKASEPWTQLYEFCKAYNYHSGVEKNGDFYLFVHNRTIS